LRILRYVWRLGNSVRSGWGELTAVCPPRAEWSSTSNAAKAAPSRGRRRAYPLVAELIGADTDSERANCFLITLMVLTCDPLAIALTAAASARKS
jgi:hypothetical protein